MHASIPLLALSLVLGVVGAAAAAPALFSFI
jgi:hypothetical protein